MPKNIYLLGYGSDIAGAATGSAKGPGVLQQSIGLQAFNQYLEWGPILTPQAHFDSKQAEVVRLCQALAELTADALAHKKFFTVIGGDHTSAIGTWSGAHHIQSPLGLIWIDAHMDSHTPDTSHTGNLHGMPLACLLGVGDPALTNIFSPAPKFKSEHVCLIAVRSYEPEELALLNELKVKVFFIDEVKQRGLKAVLQEALTIVNAGTQGFGISLDIDSIDPTEAPGTGVVASGGLSAKELCDCIRWLAKHPQLIGLEIAEYDPSRDKQQITEKLMVQLLESIIL